MNDKRDQINQYLIRLGQGDLSALGSVYELTSSSLYALCFSYLRNKFDSEEALTETYIAAKRHIEKFDGKNGYNWLYTIAKNICLNMIKKRKNEQLTDFQDEAAAKCEKFSYEMPQVGDSEIVTIAKSVLNDRELRILLLHAVGGCRFKEIAAMEGGLETTVRWQYNNALKKIRSAYEGRKGR
jgi:RNA polymerase sigma-70 factor (ECF subfamily)